jgi:hypothetical protein
MSRLLNDVFFPKRSWFLLIYRPINAKKLAGIQRRWMMGLW